ncbi:hypothetical protein B0H11DRAFT_2266918 [Mycena galericulata]|nr:hypothetical protein B0H11DRAFT_2266918 [Mycena galericulata]
MVSHLPPTGERRSARTVLTIPFEILTAILRLSLPASSKWSRFWKARRAMCLVNRYFHDTVYASPRIWTYIYITLGTTLEFVTATFQNAQALPVLVDIDITEISPSHSVPRFMQNIMPLLRMNFEHIHRLKVRSRPAQWIPLVAEIADCNPILLEHAEFRLTTPLAADLREFRLGVYPPFINMPALRHLAIICWPRIWSNTTMYSTLTSLRLGGMALHFHIAWDSLAGALQAATQLQTLAMINVCCVDLDQGRRITLPSVTRFIFQFWRPMSMAAVSLVTFPALEDLELGIGDPAQIGAVLDGQLLAAAKNVRLDTMSPWRDLTHQLLHALLHVNKLDLTGTDDFLLTCLLRLMRQPDFNFRLLSELRVPFVLETVDASTLVGPGRIVVAHPDFTQRTLAKGSLFTFKSTSPVDGEVLPTDAKRGYLRRHSIMAFGEIDAVEPLNERKGLCWRLRCPTGATCAVAESFQRQLAFLSQVLAKDALELNVVER